MDERYFLELKNRCTKGPIEYVNIAGLNPEVIEERHIRIVLPATPLHLNHVNTMYAGSIFTFAEISGARLLAATYGPDYVWVVQSAEVKYLKPGTTDLTIEESMTEDEAKERIAYIDEHGRGRYLLEFDARDTNGEVVCHFTFTYYGFTKANAPAVRCKSDK